MELIIVPPNMDYVLAREVINGVLFVLNVQVLLVFVSYVARQILRDYSDRRYGGVTTVAAEIETGPSQPTDVSWYGRAGTKAAIAMSLFMLGSSIRAGWIWALLTCQRMYGTEVCTPFSNTYPTLFYGAALALVGGLCVIRIFSPPKWRPWVWIVAGVLSLGLPFIQYNYF